MKKKCISNVLYVNEMYFGCFLNVKYVFNAKYMENDRIKHEKDYFFPRFIINKYLKRKFLPERIKYLQVSTCFTLIFVFLLQRFLQHHHHLLLLQTLVQILLNHYHYYQQLELIVQINCQDLRAQ